MELLGPQDLLTSAGPWALTAAALVIVAECAVPLGVVLPGDTLLLSVGILTGHGVVAQPLLVVVGVLVAAALAGNVVGYETGRWVGPRLLGGHASSRTARARRFFDRHGPSAVVLARFVPVLRTLVTVTAGAAGMPRRAYLAWSALGAVLWAGGLTTLGWAAGQVPFVRQHVQPHLDLLVLLAVLLVVLPTATHLVRERRRTHAPAVAVPHPVPAGQGSSRSSTP